MQHLTITAHPLPYPIEEEPRMNAQIALQAALAGMKLWDFLSLSDTQAHLLERWDIKPIGDRIHPCQLDTPQFRELVYWLADEP